MVTLWGSKVVSRAAILHFNNTLWDGSIATSVYVTYLHFEVGESVKGKCTVTLPPPWNLRLNSHWLLTKKFRSNQKVGGGGSYLLLSSTIPSCSCWLTKKSKPSRNKEGSIFPHWNYILSVCSPAYLKQSEIGRSNLNFSESLLRLSSWERSTWCMYELDSLWFINDNCYIRRVGLNFADKIQFLANNGRQYILDKVDLHKCI